jgi:hypothetical protein
MSPGSTRKHRYCGKVAPELQMVRTNALPMNYDGVVDRVKPPAPRIVLLELNRTHKGEQEQSYRRPQPSLGANLRRLRRCL